MDESSTSSAAWSVGNSSPDSSVRRERGSGGGPAADTALEHSESGQKQLRKTIPQTNATSSRAIRRFRRSTKLRSNLLSAHTNTRPNSRTIQETTLC